MVVSRALEWALELRAFYPRRKKGIALMVLFRRIVWFSVALLAMAWVGPAHAQGLSSPVSRTFVTKIAGQTVWITVIRRGPNQPPETEQTWWGWGNTTTDEYLFALGEPTHHVRMVLEFSRVSGGRLKAELFTNRLGKAPMRYRLTDGRLTILSERGNPYIVMETRQGAWLYDGKTNYNLTLWVDGLSLGQQLYPDGRPNTVIRVGQVVPGVPQWQTAKLLQDPHKTWGYSRFGAEERLASAPPFRVMEGIMPGFPYFNIGNGKFDWYQENPSPLYYSLPASQFLINQFVGFENAGNYQINSLAHPPLVDFESPFGFYNWLPNSRYSQLVVRSESFPSTDILSPYPTAHRTMTSFRYSWTGSNPTLWDYSLQLAGSIPLNQTVTIGGTKLRTIPPNTLPAWVVNQRWPLVSFVQAMNGYPGSEGIYDYTPQIPSAWPWLIGLSGGPPSYWQHPYLSMYSATRTSKTMHSGETLPVGFRGEYNADDFRKPVLYISPVDGLVHLAWATAGVWNLGKGWYIRTESLGYGPYFNVWKLKHVAKVGPYGRAKGGQTTQSLYNFGRYLIYQGKSVLIFRHSTGPIQPTIVHPPTNKTGWSEFLKATAQNRDGRAPNNLESWLNTMPGTSLVLHASSIRDVTEVGNRVHMTLTLGDAIPGKSTVPGLSSLGPGTYLATLDTISGTWTTAPAIIKNFKTKVKFRPPMLGQADQIDVSITNPSNISRELVVQIKFNGHSSQTSRLQIGAGKSIVAPFHWLPETPKGMTAKVLINDKPIDTQILRPQQPSRIELFLASLPNWDAEWAVTATTLLLSMLVAGAWYGNTRTDWRVKVGTFNRKADDQK